MARECKIKLIIVKKIGLTSVNPAITPTPISSGRGVAMINPAKVYIKERYTFLESE